MMRILLCIYCLFSATVLADEAVEKRILQIAELEKSGKHAEALERSIALTNEHPKDLPALHQLWDLQLSRGKNTDAQATFKRAMAITPNDSKSCNALALMWATGDIGTANRFSELQLKNAIALLVRATELDPKNSDAWFNLAVTHTLRMPPDLQAGAKAYRQAVKLGAERDEAMEKLFQGKP